MTKTVIKKLVSLKVLSKISQNVPPQTNKRANKQNNLMLSGKAQCLITVLSGEKKTRGRNRNEVKERIRRSETINRGRYGMFYQHRHY